MTFGSALRRGALAGVSAGLAAAVVLLLVVEPLIEEAIAIEEGRSHGLASLHGGGHVAPFAPAHGAGEPLVSRTAQVIAGALTEVLVGVALGLVFAVVFLRARHRLAGSGDFVRSAVLSCVGFGVVSLLPALTLPANPPGVGDPATVGRRTILHAVVLLVGIAVALGVPSLDRWLDRSHARRISAPTRWSLEILAVLVAVILVLGLVPDVSGPVPADVPAGLLWDFRLASLAQLGVLWLVLGTCFGLLMERRARAPRRPLAEATA